MSTQSCNVEGCINKASKRGYCRKHYYHIQKFGEIRKTSYEPNDLEIQGEITYIVLRDKSLNITGMAIIDTSNIEKIKPYKWYMLDNRGYVVCDKGKKRIFLHRLLLNTDKDSVVDHVNHNPLDNRLENLRTCSQRENAYNSKARQISSRYKGVGWYPDYGKWRVRVNNKFVGYFDGEVDAALEYNEAAKQEFGKFAYLNEVG